MIVTVDGEKLVRDFKVGSTLQEVIDQARAGLNGERIVVSVAVNGEAYAEAALAEALDVPVPPEAQVDLETGGRAEIAAAALRSVAEELDGLALRQPEIAEQLSAGQTADAIRQVGEVVQVWVACQTAIVQGSGLLGRNLTALEVNGQVVEARLTDLVERLRELRDVLEAQDLVLLADLLHYELPALCHEWRDTLLDLAAQTEAA